MTKDGENTTGGMRYRWVCPVCDDSNIGFSNQNDPTKRAVEALQSHIRICEGDGHGQEYEIPDKWSSEALKPYTEVTES